MELKDATHCPALQHRSQICCTNTCGKRSTMAAQLLLWFNLMRVEIHELRPKVVAEDDEVLVRYRSRTNVTMITF